MNTQELVEAMPEMQSAKSELEKLAKTYETDIQAMATELQNKIKQNLLTKCHNIHLKDLNFINFIIF